MRKTIKETKGITLVALVITIIVLLILAIVSIRLVINEGILKHAETATQKYNVAQEEERVNLAVLSVKMSNNSGNITYENLNAALEAEFGAGKINYTSTQAPFTFTIVNGSGKQYTVAIDGTVNGPINITRDYPLKNYFKDNSGLLEFMDDTFVNAYDAVLASYGKTVETTDMLTSYIAVKTLEEAYSEQMKQEGYEEAFERALSGKFIVANRWYGSEGPEMNGNFSSDENVFKNIVFLRSMQMEAIRGMTQAVTSDGYMICPWITSEEDKQAANIYFPGGGLDGKPYRVGTQTTNFGDNEAEAFKSLKPKVEVLTEENFDDYIQIDSESIDDANREEKKQQYKGKLILYIGGLNEGELKNKKRRNNLKKCLFS